MNRFFILFVVLCVGSWSLARVDQPKFTPPSAPRHEKLPVEKMFVVKALSKKPSSNLYRSSRWSSIRARSSRSGRSHFWSGGK